MEKGSCLTTENNLFTKKRVFISWSGEASKDLSEELEKILNDIFDDKIDFFLSFKNIALGDMWFNELKNTLNQTDCGLLVLTDGNINSPWILFEAGAIFQTTKVFPVNFSTEQVKNCKTPFHSLQSIHGFNIENLISLAINLNEYLNINIPNNLLKRYISSDERIQNSKLFNYDNKGMRAHETLTIDKIKKSGEYFRELHNKNSIDLIVGLNYGGSILAPIVSYRIQKPIDFYFMQNVNDKRTIKFHSLNQSVKSENKKNIKNILILDAKLRSGEGIIEIITDLLLRYLEIENIYISSSLLYLDKPDDSNKTEKEIKKESMKEKEDHLKKILSLSYLEKLYHTIEDKEENKKIKEEIKEALDEKNYEKKIEKEDAIIKALKDEKNYEKIENLIKLINKEYKPNLKLNSYFYTYSPSNPDYDSIPDELDPYK